MDAEQSELCDVCHTQTFKYRCPKCQYKSCSLSCSVKHKNLNNCDGIKKAIENVPLDKMTTKTMVKDINFLMKIQHKIGISERDLRLRSYQSKSDNQRFFDLSQACRARQIRLFLQPNGMSRHTENETNVTILNQNKQSSVESQASLSQCKENDTATSPKPDRDASSVNGETKCNENSTKHKTDKNDGNNEKDANENNDNTVAKEIESLDTSSIEKNVTVGANIVEKNGIRNKERNKERRKDKNDENEKNEKKNKRRRNKSAKQNKFGVKNSEILWTICIECGNRQFLIHNNNENDSLLSIIEKFRNIYFDKSIWKEYANALNNKMNDNELNSNMKQFIIENDKNVSQKQQTKTNSNEDDGDDDDIDISSKDLNNLSKFKYMKYFRIDDKDNIILPQKILKTKRKNNKQTKEEINEKNESNTNENKNENGMNNNNKVESTTAMNKTAEDSKSTDNTQIAATSNTSESYMQFNFGSLSSAVGVSTESTSNIEPTVTAPPSESKGKLISIVDYSDSDSDSSDNENDATNNDTSDCDNKKEHYSKLTIALQIPNFHVKLRINPNMNLIKLLKNQIVLEYPTFSIYLENELLNNDKKSIVMSDEIDRHRMQSILNINKKFQEIKQNVKAEMIKQMQEPQMHYNNHNNHNNHNNRNNKNNNHRNKYNNNHNNNNHYNNKRNNRNNNNNNGRRGRQDNENKAFDNNDIFMPKQKRQRFNSNRRNSNTSSNNNNNNNNNGFNNNNNNNGNANRNENVNMNQSRQAINNVANAYNFGNINYNQHFALLQQQHQQQQQRFFQQPQHYMPSLITPTLSNLPTIPPPASPTNKKINRNANDLFMHL